MKRLLIFTILCMPMIRCLVPDVPAQIVWHKASGIDSLALNSFFVHKGRCFAGTADSGVYISGNNGVSWTESAAGIIDSAVLRMANSFAVSGDTIYAAFGDALGGHIYTSQDTGTTWTPTSFTTGATDIAAIGPVVCASTGSGFFLYGRSTDHGATWQITQYPFIYYYRRYQSFRDTLFAISISQGLVMSSDRGDTWQSIGFSSEVCLDYFIRPEVTGVSTLNGIFLSPDRGNTWVPAETTGLGGDVTGIINFTISGDTLFAASDTAVYYSVINGSVLSGWTQLSGNGLPLLSDTLYISDITIAGGNLILGTINALTIGTSAHAKGVGIWYAPLGGLSGISNGHRESRAGLYPNPASASVRIVTGWKNWSWQVMSSDGRIAPCRGDGTEIDVSQLPDGLYFVILKDSAGHVQAEPFVKAAEQ